MSKLTGIEDLDPRATVVKQTASVIPFLIKTAVICGIGYYVYYRFTNRFVKLRENSNYPVANVTIAQAKTRADAIAGSIGWFSNSFDAVADSLAGLNYNGFIRVYNEFGEHSGTLFAGDLNLIEWIKNQFTEDEILQLSSLQNGVFFRSGTTSKVMAFNNFLNQFDFNEKEEFYNLLAA